MQKTIIAAKSQNNVIGKNGQLPWHLPVDLRFFKEQTMGHYILLGRKTYESLATELVGRKLIILSKDKDYNVESGQIVNTLNEGFDIAQKNREDELYIAGGGSIYKQTIDLVDKMYITQIKATFTGDTFFPKIDKDKWKIKKIKEYEQNDKRLYSFQILEYVRKS